MVRLCSPRQTTVILSEDEEEYDAQSNSVRNFSARVTLRLTPAPENKHLSHSKYFFWKINFSLSSLLRK